MGLKLRVCAAAVIAVITTVATANGNRDCNIKLTQVAVAVTRFSNKP